MKKCIGVRELFRTYKELILYLFFGGCTVIINTVCYVLLYDGLSINNIVSTIIAWIIAVIFAFVTNKLYVFESHRENRTEGLREMVCFLGCRLFTGILDVAIMAVAVDMMQRNGLIWKMISNIIVIIINYIASKFLIFKGTK